MIDGARLVDSEGQWAIPCDTTVPMSFTFGQVYTSLFYLSSNTQLYLEVTITPCYLRIT